MFTKQTDHRTPLPLRPLHRCGTILSLVAFLWLLFVPSVVSAIDPEGPPAAAKKKILQLELALAKKGEVYTLLNLSSQGLILKIKGFPLKQFHFSEISLEKAERLREPVHRLIKKYPPPPAVEKEIPLSGAPETRVSSLLSTETVFVSVGDMPSRYRLYFEDGLMISIEPARRECNCGKIHSGLSLIKETAVSLSWEAERLLFDRRFPDLRLVLSEEEAQALFWSLSEGAWLLIDSGS
ncbi:MAG: hypothetical protein EPO39_16845 [Candidatus Manganitrophaceae bacterium]|nr:MAG: hypothetical protein EPO39_16845 [Candidatus Manganitrophaceae bacterium]